MKKVKETEQQTNIPQWHIDLVRERQINYQNNSNDALDFNVAMDAIEEELKDPFG